MKKLFSLLVLVMMVSGCATLFGVKYSSFGLPTGSYDEAQYIVSQFRKIHYLNNKYNVSFFSSDEMIPDKQRQRANMELPDNVVYIDEAYIKFLHYYKNGKYYRIRKRDLACVIAHEIAHRELNLLDDTFRIENIVDEQAIKYLAELGIKWNHYIEALKRVREFMNTMRGLWPGKFHEKDLSHRMWVLGEQMSLSYYKMEFGVEEADDIDRITDWDFPGVSKKE